MDTGVLQEAFVLAMHGTSVAKARHRTVEWLLRHSVSRDAADTVELITSELVTNALVHSVSDVISCGLQLENGRLRIEVTDQGAYEAEPTIRQPCLEDVSGRGLLLVEMLSEEWGVIPVLPCGRTVWAVVRTHQ